MQLHELKPLHKNKKPKRIGFGGKHGTHSGRGVKGQTSRPSFRLQPIIRGLIKRYPKLRGHRSRAMILNAASRVVIVNLDILEKKFNSEEKITPETLSEKGIVGKIRGEMPTIKILGDGKLTKALIVENCLTSKKAKEAIEKAGGKITAKTTSHVDR